MRLIDADEFALLLMRMQAVNEEIPLRKDRLANKEINNYNTGQKETFDLILQNLEKQPTAYNVDKVVEQLESEAKRWEEYKTLEEQGKLLKLPVAVGDKVYQHMIIGVDKVKRKPIYEIFEATVFKFSLSSCGLCFWTETADDKKYQNEVTVSAFGKTVFLTQEAAEAALKEMEWGKGK